MNRRRTSKENKIMEFIKTPIIKHILLAVGIVFIAVVVTNIFLMVITRHGQVREVPDFSGMSIEQAMAAGAKYELQITINDSLYVPELVGGAILEQTPLPGTQVKNNRRIFVTVNSFAQRLVRIPYVTGYSLRQAKNNLEVAGLGIEKLIYTDDIATNNVISQRYGNQTIEESSRLEAPKGSGITLVVGRADENIQQEIPMVAGLTFAQAKSRLWESGFNIGKVEYGQDINSTNMLNAKVMMQIPYGGTYENLGNQVSLRLSLDQEQIEKGVNDANKQYLELEKIRKAEQDSIALLETLDSEIPLLQNE